MGVERFAGFGFKVRCWLVIFLRELDLVVLYRTSPVIIISHLLKLMSTASKKNEWLRPALSNLLSERLAADGGVRSLLIIVIGDDENTSTSKLSTLSQLLRAGVTGSNKLVSLTYLSFSCNDFL